MALKCSNFKQKKVGKFGITYNMKNVFFEGTVIWAQVDANRHMRHSAYADFGAQARLAMLEKVNMPPQVFAAKF